MITAHGHRMDGDRQQLTNLVNPPILELISNDLITNLISDITSCEHI